MLTKAKPLTQLAAGTSERAATVQAFVAKGSGRGRPRLRTIGGSRAVHDRGDRSRDAQVLGICQSILSELAGVAAGDAIITLFRGRAVMSPIRFAAVAALAAAGAWPFHAAAAPAHPRAKARRAHPRPPAPAATTPAGARRRRPSSRPERTCCSISRAAPAGRAERRRAARPGVADQAHDGVRRVRRAREKADLAVAEGDGLAGAHGTPRARACSSSRARAVTVDELIRGMVVQSGNDASIALAEAVAGTEEVFVAADEPRGGAARAQEHALHQRHRACPDRSTTAPRATCRPRRRR